MKVCTIFIFAVAFLAVVIADDGPEKKMPESVKRIFDECSEENAVTPRSLCMHNKFGFQKLNGDIDKDRMRIEIKKMPNNDDDLVEKVVADCGNRVGDTPAEAATNLETCMKKYLRPRNRQYQYRQH